MADYSFFVGVTSNLYSGGGLQICAQMAPIFPNQFLSEDGSLPSSPELLASPHSKEQVEDPLRKGISV